MKHPLVEENEVRSKVYRSGEYFQDLVGRDVGQARRLRQKPKPRKANYLSLLGISTALAVLALSVFSLGMPWFIALIAAAAVLAVAAVISGLRPSFRAQGERQPPVAKSRKQCRHFQGEADRCSYLSGARCVRR